MDLNTFSTREIPKNFFLIRDNSEEFDNVKREDRSESIVALTGDDDIYNIKKPVIKQVIKQFSI